MTLLHARIVSVSNKSASACVKMFAVILCYLKRDDLSIINRSLWMGIAPPRDMFDAFSVKMTRFGACFSAYKMLHT